MTIAIQDANIIIDLLDIKLFKLEISFYSTPFVLSKISDFLIEKGLLMADRLNKSEIMDIRNLNNQVKALLVADGLVFILAERMNATILTGDMYLRKFAVKNDLQVHGILWVFDMLIKSHSCPV